MRLSHKFMLYSAVSAEMVSGHGRQRGRKGRSTMLKDIRDAPVYIPVRFTTEN